VIGFLHPWVLLGLPLAALPLVLHLVQRRDPPTIEFPAVRYLVQVTQEHQRRLRLRHWLLLLVRTLLVLALVLAGAAPTAPLRQAGTHSPSALVLILDDSPSSGVVVDGTPRLSALRQTAHRILERATPSDALWLLTSDGLLRRGAPEALLRRVDSLTPSERRMDLGSAVSQAIDVLRSDPRPGGIVVVTDLQASALSPAAPAVPVVVARPTGPSPVNVGLTAISTSAQPWTPDGGTAVVRAEGDSTPPVPVTTALGDRPGRQALVPVGGEVSFALPGAPPGWWVLHATKTPDELRSDDARVALIRVVPVAQGTWDASDRYLSAAGEVLVSSGRLGRGGRLRLGELGPGPSAVVPPADPAMLGSVNRALARRGVAWQFGPLTTIPGVSDSGPLLGRIQVLRRYTLERPGSIPAGEILVTVGGAPWIVRSGDVVLLGSRLDPTWTGLPLSARFVPFLDAVVNQLARGPIVLLDAAPGDPVLLPEAVTEVDRGGQRWRVEGGSAFHPPETGIYYLLGGPDTLGGISVNVDPRESKLQPASDANVRALWRGARITDLDDAASAAFAGVGRAGLQAPLLWLAFALMVGEVALASGLRRAA
jgi:Aerotolerance regulator N-terminal